MNAMDMPLNAVPVPPELQEGYLFPLIEAATVAFREVVGVELIVEATGQTNEPFACDGRAATIEQRFPFGTGKLRLAVSSVTELELAKRMLPDAANDLDAQLADDCLGELTNVVAGQGKALLAESNWHYTIGTPKTGPIERESESHSWIVVVFGSELGRVLLMTANPNGM